VCSGHFEVPSIKFTDFPCYLSVKDIIFLNNVCYTEVLCICFLGLVLVAVESAGRCTNGSMLR